MIKKIAIFSSIIFIVLLLLLMLLLRSNANDDKNNIKINKVPTTIPQYTQNAPPIDNKDRSDAPVIEWEKALEVYKAEEPDFFLANFTPYETSEFSITRMLREKPKSHYGFIVFLKGNNTLEGRQSAVEWIKSLGLSEKQIQGLDLTFASK